MQVFTFTIDVSLYLRKIPYDDGPEEKMGREIDVYIRG